MGDTMLIGVLRMPPELWNGTELDVRQRHSRYMQAADTITALRAEVERLEMKLREKQREMDITEAGNREDILALRAFGERATNEISARDAEVERLKGDLNTVTCRFSEYADSSVEAEALLRAEVVRLQSAFVDIAIADDIGKLRSQLSARDAEGRALREHIAKFRAWVQHHDDCDEYPLDGYEREHGVPPGESVCNCGLNALLTASRG